MISGLPGCLLCWAAVAAAGRAAGGGAAGRERAAGQALATLGRERDGLIAHREYPVISLGQLGRRALRRPVVTRKNARRSRNKDAARLAAR